MKRHISIFALIFITGCQPSLPMDMPGVTATPRVSMPSPAEEKLNWSVYDPDPKHLWNQVFRRLYQRTAVNGEEFGFDELDPLLWFDTKHLLTGPSHQQAIQTLDEFISSRGDNLIRDPLKRAMLQRDLWAVFDWLASPREPYRSQRQALQSRLVLIIRRVSLSKDEIVSLPDNYAREVEAGTFPAVVPADETQAAFLPSDLFQPDSAWVPLGRKGGPIAMTHTEAFPFYGRSVFLVIVRSPGGRAATFDFIESLNTQGNPVTTIGSEIALVRRMLLIDDQGEIMLSPLVETIQIRHFRPAQSFHEFELSRSRLFEGIGGGLLPKDEIFMLFMGHGDVFENPVPELRVAIPEICSACHFEYPPIPNSGNTRSIISYSRQPFALPDNQSPVLFPITVNGEAQTVIEWKRNHGTWKALKTLWDRASP